MPWLSILLGLVAVALILLGLVGMATALTPGGTVSRFAIPPDENTGTGLLRPYYHFAMSLFSGAKVIVNWTVTSGGPVALFIVDQATFLAIFLSGPNASTPIIGASAGINGTFVAPIPNAGGYQLLILHAMIDYSRTAMGNVTVFVEGRDQVGLAIGLGEITGGALLAVAAAAVWRRPRKVQLVRRLSVCPTCGTTANPGADYCPSCGTKLRVPVNDSGPPPSEPGTGLE